MKLTWLPVFIALKGGITSTLWRWEPGNIMSNRVEQRNQNEIPCPEVENESKFASHQLEQTMIKGRVGTLAATEIFQMPTFDNQHGSYSNHVTNGEPSNKSTRAMEGTKSMSYSSRDSPCFPKQQEASRQDEGYGQRNDSIKRRSSIMITLTICRF